MMETTTKDRFGRWWMGGLVLVGLVAAVLSVVRPDLGKAEAWQQFLNPPQESATSERDIGPAPTLKKGPTKNVKGHKMSTWIASGAGDETYNGTYLEDGTNAGKPKYTNGAHYLFWDGYLWALGSPGMPEEAYVGTGADLPASPWGIGPDSGTSPAPTLVAVTIVIDSPTDGAHLPSPNVAVSGHCTGDVSGLYMQWVIDSVVAGFVPATATWSEILSFGVGETVEIVRRLVEMGETVIATSNEVTVEIDDVPGGGGGEGPIGGSTEPELRLALPLEGATIGPAPTALVQYSGFTGASGTLLIMLIGGGDSWTLVNATRAIAPGGGDYAELLTLPEGLAEGDYTILARLTSGEEQSSDSHTVTYDETPGAGTPPTVVISAPADSASVSGAVAVTATATDDIGLFKMALYVDDNLIGGQVIEGPGNGVAQSLVWDSKVWANGSHEIKVMAWDADLASGEDTVSVNLVNSQADSELLFWTPQLGTDAGGVPINDESADFAGIFERAMEIIEPLKGLPTDVNLLRALQVGWNVPGASHAWGDMTVVDPVGWSHWVAAGRTIRWMMRGTPRQKLASWTILEDELIRLAQDPEGNVLALAAGTVYKLVTATGALSTWRDLSEWAGTTPVDMVVADGKVFVAAGAELVVLDLDAADETMTVGLESDVTAITALAAAVDGTVIVAADVSGGGSRIYSLTWPSKRAQTTHTESITALAVIGQMVFVGDAAGGIYLLDDGPQLQYATGEAAVRRIFASGVVLFAGTGDSGNIFQCPVTWALSADMGWTAARALGTLNGWLFAGGTGTGGSYLWRQNNDGWAQTLELEGATGVNDLLGISVGGREQLFVATVGAAGECVLVRVEITPATRLQMANEFPNFRGKIVRSRAS
jgi:hypothetical protein